MLFAEAKFSQLKVIMDVLRDIENIYGLAVNVEKSKAMVSKVMTRWKKDKLASISSISFTSNLGKYLGFYLV